MNFIQTNDEITKDLLIKQGFQLVNESINMWTFLNNEKLVFASDNNKIVYTNKLCF